MSFSTERCWDGLTSAEPESPDADPAPFGVPTHPGEPRTRHLGTSVFSQTIGVARDEMVRGWHYRQDRGVVSGVTLPHRRTPEMLDTAVSSGYGEPLHITLALY